MVPYRTWLFVVCGYPSMPCAAAAGWLRTPHAEIRIRLRARGTWVRSRLTPPPPTLHCRHRSICELPRSPPFSRLDVSSALEFVAADAALCATSDACRDTFHLRKKISCAPCIACMGLCDRYSLLALSKQWSPPLPYRYPKK